jgi:hypothetical protein
MLQDPRMIDVLGVAMGIDMRGYERPEGSTDLPEDLQQQTREQPTSPPPQPRAQSPPPAASSSKTTSTPPAPEPEPMEVEVSDEERQAVEAKKRGSEAYRKRQFEEAAQEFSKAWELWPKDITFLTNLGGEHTS